MTHATRCPLRASAAHSLDFFGFCSTRIAPSGNSTWRRPEREKLRTPRPPPKSFSKATRITPASGASLAFVTSPSSRRLPCATRVRPLCSVVAVAADEAVDELDQFSGAEGLRDVRVEAGSEGALAILVGGERRDGDAGDAPRALVGAQLSEQPPAVERGHREVYERGGGHVFARRVERLAPVARLPDVVALGLQHQAQEFAVVVVVVCDENAVGHRREIRGL